MDLNYARITDGETCHWVARPNSFATYRIIVLSNMQSMNSQKPKWIGQPFTVGIFVRTFLEENVGTLIQIT